MTTRPDQRPNARDLDLWLIDKDVEGVVKPGPGVVYDRRGMGIVLMDERGRDATFIDTGRALQARAGPGHAPPPLSPATWLAPLSASRTTPTA